MITGACGFIGSHLTKSLIDADYEVCAIDNLDNNLYPSIVKQDRLKYLRQNGLKNFYELDLSKDNFDNILDGATYVFNLAALPGQVLSWSIFDKYVDANILGTQRLIEGSIRHGVKKMIHASTSSVYGKNALGIENQELSPISPYGLTKLAAENLIKAYSQFSDLNYVILRLFSVYGPWQRPDMAISRFIEQISTGKKVFIHGDGSQSRDVTYVEDVVRAFNLSVDDKTNGRTFDIASGKTYSILTIVNEISNLIGVKSDIEFIDRPNGDQEKTLGSLTGAKEFLNYHPAVSLSQGLKNQINFYLHKKHDDGQI